jgi:hypothetical protein
MDTNRNKREQNSSKINKHLETYILSDGIDDINGADEHDDSRTELDSHANMPVVGRCAFIISDTGRIADVHAYSPEYESKEIHIVDAAVK